MNQSQLRNNDFPTSLNGKAFDTALVLSWLEVDMLPESAPGLVCGDQWFTVPPMILEG